MRGDRARLRQLVPERIIEKPARWEPLRCPKTRQLSFFSIEFVRVHGRDPSAGDILRYTDLKASGITIEDANEWRTIWERRVPEYSFPFRHEGGFLFVLLADYVREKPDAHSEDFNLYGMRFLSSAGHGLRIRGWVPVVVGAMWSEVGRRERKSGNSSLQSGCFF